MNPYPFQGDSDIQPVTCSGIGERAVPVAANATYPVTRRPVGACEDVPMTDL